MFANGDALITLDSTTGLEWLDITAIAGLSYEQVEASQYCRDLGFAHASVAQIETMLSDAGVSDYSASFSSREELLADPGVRNVLEYFRMTSTTFDQPIEESGVLRVIARQTAQTGAHPGSLPDFHFYGAIQARVAGGFIGDPWQFEMEINKRLPLVGGIEIVGETQPWTGGHYLVRDARVPELMSTAWLSLTIFGLFFGKRFLSGGTTQS